MAPPTIMCPACAKDIARWATRCPYCHTALEPWTGWRALTKQTQRAAAVQALASVAAQPTTGRDAPRNAAVSNDALELLRNLRNTGRLSREEFLVLKRGMRA